MADFELCVAEKAFQRVGIRPIFDENLYSELLDIALESSDVTGTYRPPTVELEPHPALGLSKLNTVRLMLGDKYDYAKAGHYNKDNATIYTRCFAKAGRTNRALRHETKHWADDNAGTLETDSARMRSNIKKSMVGSVALGALTMLGAGAFIDGQVVEPLAGTVCLAGGFIVAPQVCYSRAAHERAARQFMDDPELKEMYDSVVRYEQL